MIFNIICYVLCNKTKSCGCFDIFSRIPDLKNFKIKTHVELKSKNNLTDDRKNGSSSITTVNKNSIH